MENTFALFTSTNLRVHNSFSENYKKFNKQKTGTRTPFWATVKGNRSSQLCVESCGKVRGHFLWDPGPINATRVKKNIGLMIIN